MGWDEDTFMFMLKDVSRINYNSDARYLGYQDVSRLAGLGRRYLQFYARGCFKNKLPRMEGTFGIQASQPGAEPGLRVRRNRTIRNLAASQAETSGTCSYLNVRHTCHVHAWYRFT
jgi:hypothetical protein